MKKIKDEIKEEITHNVLMYIVYEDEKFKSIVIEHLNTMYKRYNITKSKTVVMYLKDALTAFIENKKGYPITLNNLYFSL